MPPRYREPNTGACYPSPCHQMMRWLLPLVVLVLVAAPAAHAPATAAPIISIRARTDLQLHAVRRREHQPRRLDDAAAMRRTGCAPGDREADDA